MNINEFENKLMNLAPVEPGLDPAAVAYEAGFRQGRKNTRIWQVSNGCMILLVMVLAFVNMANNRSQTVPEMSFGNIKLVVQDNADSEFDKTNLETNVVSGPVNELDENSYLLLRRQVFDHGLEVLPKSTGKNGKVYSLKDMLNS